MAFDAARDRLVVFGGIDPPAFTILPRDIWEWDGEQWYRIPPQPGPEGRLDLSMIYDPDSQRVVMFGGARGGGPSDELWYWNGIEWVATAPEFAPPPRRRAAIAYDTARRRVQVFGGTFNTIFYMNDFWEWDGTVWSIQPSGPPAVDSSLVYNPIRGKSLVLSNYSAWELNGAAGTWTQLGSFGAAGWGGVGRGLFDPGLASVVAPSGQRLTLWNYNGSESPLYIATQPQGVSCTPGFICSVNVVVGGSPISYQWFKDGVPVVNGGTISGATSHQLTFNPFREVDVGAYRVSASNVCGTVNSVTVSIALPPPPGPCGSPACWANCDGSTGCPVLTANDLVCFVGRFIAGESYADCDGVGGLVGAEDFTCFLGKYSAGCS